MKKYRPLFHIILASTLLSVLIFSGIRCSDPFEEEGPIVTDDPVSVTDQFTIDNAGGEFLLASGIIVTIPEGAVTESKEIKVDNLKFEDALALDTIIASDDSPFLFGVSISTDNFNFIKPVKIKIPVQNLDENGLPVLFELQGDNNNWLFSDEEIIVSNKEKYVEIILKESTNPKNSLKKSNESIDAVRHFLSQFYTGVFGIDGSVLLPEHPCKGGDFSSIVEHIDVANSGKGCKGKSIIEKFTYLDCKPPISGYYKITKISPSCEPKISISAPDELEVGESGSINMSVSLGDDIPLPDQKIDLVGKKLLGVKPNSQTTRSNGEAPTFEVIAGDKAGDGLVTGTVSLDYYLTLVSAYNSETGKVEQNGKEYNHVKKDIDVIINILVVGIPELFTTFSTNPEGNIAIIGGEITEDWEEEITERGVYLNDEKIPLGKGSGSFSTERQNFEQGIINKVKAYAINRFGTGYGEEIRFVVDIDANIYTVITIGDQEWIGENLKTTRLNDGTLIGYTKIDDDTGVLDYYNSETGTRTWYDNKESNNKVYGTLYSSDVVKTEKLCPTGWRVPSENDFLILTNFAGGYEQAGGKFKETGTSHWSSPNTGATNEFGLTALPGGILNREGLVFNHQDYYMHIGEQGVWWTTSISSDNYHSANDPLKGVFLSYDSSEAFFGAQSNFTLHISCRCIKD